MSEQIAPMSQKKLDSCARGLADVIGMTFSEAARTRWGTGPRCRRSQSGWARERAGRVLDAQGQPGSLPARHPVWWGDAPEREARSTAVAAASVASTSVVAALRTSRSAAMATG